MCKIKLSTTTKMPCSSWSLQAGATCHSLDKHGNIKLSCQKCYAQKGNYIWDNVVSLREYNRTNWKEDEWVSSMVDTLNQKRNKYFRWFDSGDIYHPELAHKIAEVILNTPEVNHWLPTMSHSNPKVLDKLRFIKQLPNVMVRYSSGQINGGYLKQHGSTVVQLKQVRERKVSEKIHVCKVYKDEQTGYDVKKCDQGGTCRACWSKDVPVVAYVQH